MTRRLLPLLCLLPLPAHATDPAADEAPARLEPFSILGSSARVDRIPGSAHRLGEPELERFEQADILRVLRAVPGVYIQEEDGYGLRPNIGIRGSGLDRSSRITLLEDNVLIAPAPYAAPSAYYFPTQRRMSAVEVLKGPAALIGPRTTGGAVNLVSTPIPEQRDANVDLFGGQDGFFETHAWYGDSQERAGWLIETVQQRSDGFKDLDSGGDTGFDVGDYLGKLRLNTDSSAALYQSLELKLGYTDHESEETYLGLTDEDFEATPFRRYAASQNDLMSTEHRQYQATWLLEPRDGAWSLSVTGYRNEFERNWFKLEGVDGTSTSNILADPDAFAEQFAWITGEADSPDDALTLRNNNRSYVSQGVQANWLTAFDTGRVAHNLEIGVRLHEDEVDRFQDEDLYAIRSGALQLTTDGEPGSQSNRVSDASVVALFVRDTVDVGRWSLQPGFRYETIDLTREDYSTADPDRSEGPTRVRENDVDVFIPGFGASYSLNDRWLLIGGVHRGFNPPAPGSGASEEESVNYELGARFASGALSAEAIGFYSDYDNLVGTCTVSTGGGCDVGDQFDGGQASVGGLEVLGTWTTSLGDTGLRLPLRLAYTWTPVAEFDNAFDSDFSPWGDVQAGDELPYIPEHQVQLGADLTADNWSVGLNAAFVDETRTVAGQGSIAAGEATDSFVVVDLVASYRLNRQFDLFARVDNLFADEYVVARRPAGARPGQDRRAIAGFRFRL